MARPWAAALALAACLAALTPGTYAAEASPDYQEGLQPAPQPQRGLEALLPTIRIHTSVQTARQLLQTLNSSAGSDQNELITLQGAPARGVW